MKKKREYESPRFMSVDIAAQQILQIIKEKNSNGKICF